MVICHTERPKCTQFQTVTPRALQCTTSLYIYRVQTQISPRKLLCRSPFIHFKGKERQCRLSAFAEGHSIMVWLGLNLQVHCHSQSDDNFFFINLIYFLLPQQVCHFSTIQLSTLSSMVTLLCIHYIWPKYASPMGFCINCPRVLDIR